MVTSIESIPGVKTDERRSYIYVPCDDFRSFRKFFAGIEIVLGAPRPKSGSLMNCEVQLVLPSSEKFCAICMTGDQQAWRKVVEVYCSSVGIPTAVAKDEELAISDGRQIPLNQCAIESSHGR